MDRRRTNWFTLIFLLSSALGLHGQELPVPDQPVQAHPEGDAAIDRLLSPYCPGLMLEVCPSPQAKLLRDSLQVMAHNGATADSLVSWMLGMYGEKYRAVPRIWGSGLFAWLMPPVILLGGFLLVVLVLKRFRGRQVDSAPALDPLSTEDESLLASALQELKVGEEMPF